MRYRLWLLIVVVACSKDRMFSFDPDTKISSLSGRELVQLCEEGVAYGARSPSATTQMCAWTSAMSASNLAHKSPPPTTATLRAECKKAYDACMANPPPIPPADCAAEALDDRSRCTATVGELSHCLLAVAADQANQDLCAELDAEQPLAIVERLVGVYKIDACKPVDDSCL
jgi:hypothetical protein